MIPDAHIWFFWASAFLVPWTGLFVAFPRHRKTMLWASLFTMPFGLTEPLFVPEYWNPPSLFDLAARTGFDVESLIFSFGIGGVGAALFDILSGQLPQPMAAPERRARRHRFHKWALASPFLVFVALSFSAWNAIYLGIVAMAFGSIATVICRPDLKRATLAGGVIFLLYYTLFLVGLRLTAPGYIDRVWNLQALTGIRVAGLPLEELLFALFFGTYWGGVYEHFTWHRSMKAEPAVSAAP